MSAAMNGELFTAGLAPKFPEGAANAHLLIRCIEDRGEHAERWTQVLEATDVPLTFV